MNVLARHRIALGIAAIVLALLGGGFVAWTGAKRDSAPAVAAPPARGGLLFVDLRSYRGQADRLALADPGGRRTRTSLKCQRICVAVAKDDRTFYPTMATAGRTWLMKDDLVTRTMTDLRQTAECPSLSPDGTKVTYKKRTSRTGPWRLAVTNLGTGAEAVIEGTSGIDDQARGSTTTTWSTRRREALVDVRGARGRVGGAAGADRRSSLSGARAPAAQDRNQARFTVLPSRSASRSETPFSPRSARPPQTSRASSPLSNVGSGPS